MIKSENQKKLIAEFIKHLRNNRHTTVNQIINETGLTRVSLNDLEKERRKRITKNVYESFKEAYGEEFVKFEKQFSLQSDVMVIEKSEFEELKSAIVDMAKEMVALQRENRELKEKLKTLKE